MASVMEEREAGLCRSAFFMLKNMKRSKVWKKIKNGFWLVHLHL